MNLSKNFSYSAFIKSQTAQRKGINNNMPPAHLENAIHLSDTVLQPVRDEHGVTMVNSGYRCERLNKEIGGADGSQHTKGEAGDIEVPGLSTYDLFIWIKDNLVFDQLILEFHDPEDPSSGWVHVSKKRNGLDRCQCLVAKRVKRKVVYEQFVDERDKEI